MLMYVFMDGLFIAISMIEKNFGAKREMLY